jgi:hypothetical protein
MFLAIGAVAVGASSVAILLFLVFQRYWSALPAGTHHERQGINSSDDSADPQFHLDQA